MRHPAAGLQKWYTRPVTRGGQQSFWASQDQKPLAHRASHHFAFCNHDFSDFFQFFDHRKLSGVVCYVNRQDNKAKFRIPVCLCSFSSTVAQCIFIYTSVLQLRMCEAIYRVIVTFCCECHLFNMRKQAYLANVSKRQWKKMMEDEEIMKCLTKLHDAEVSQQEKA